MEGWLDLDGWVCHGVSVINQVMERDVAPW